MTPLFRPLHDYTLNPDAVDEPPVTWADSVAASRASGRQPILLGSRTVLRQRYGLEPVPQEKPLHDGRFDLEEWRQAFVADGEFSTPEEAGSAAEDILFALRKYNAELAELTQASQRPHSRFPLRTDDAFAVGLQSYLAKVKSWFHVFRLRALARTAAGDASGAFADVQTMLRIAEGLKDESHLLSQLVRLSFNQIAMNALWQIWADRRWKDEQLHWFQDFFAAQDVRDGLARNVPLGEVVAPKFDRAQITIDLAAAACALERYRLMHGECPESLESLVPEFVSQVPRDLIDGQPLGYRKRGDGWFDLYSVAQNRQDDGGIFLRADGVEADYAWPLPIPQEGRRSL